MLNDKIKVPCSCGKSTTIRVRKLSEMEKRIKELEDENKGLKIKVAALEVMRARKQDSFSDVLNGLF